MSATLELKNLEAMRRELTSAAAKATKSREEKGKKAAAASGRVEDARGPSVVVHHLRSGISDQCDPSHFARSMSSESISIVNLPDCVLQNVLQFLSFDQVSQMRLVCHRFDQVSRYTLNRGFRNAERFHARCMREVKAKLPRRESERRNHPLARHCDILTAIETRISLLAMTFMKFVDVDMCCFIPGKVIDEIFKILRTIQQDKNPPRAYEILQELRDISSMAMEYFDEKIVPTLKLSYGSSGGDSSMALTPKFQSPATYLSGFPAILTASSPPTPMRTNKLSIASGQSSGFAFGERMLAVEKRLKTLGKRSRKQQNILQDQAVKISSLEGLVGSQQALITNQAEKLKDQECKFAELSRKLLEKDQNMKDLLQKFESKFAAGGGRGVKRRVNEIDGTGSVTKKSKP